jgi:hypothetical protein
LKALGSVHHGQRLPPLAILIAPENYRYHAAYFGLNFRTAFNAYFALLMYQRKEDPRKSKMGKRSTQRGVYQTPTTEAKKTTRSAAVQEKN